MVCGQHPFQKVATVQRADGKILIEEGKDKPSQWSGWHVVFLVVMGELNRKSPNVWVHTDLLVMANDPAIWSNRWVCLLGHRPECKPLWEYERHVRVEPVAAY